MSEIRLDGRVVVVTGAGGGLGRAYARQLAQRGARVVVNDTGGDVHGTGGEASAAAAVVDEIRAAGGIACASTDSVATPEGGAAIIDTALREFGRLDALVHNAGILRDRSVANLRPDDIDAVLDVHLRGGFHVAVPAFAAMKATGGRIVLTSSASGLFGTFGQANYAAAKMGLVGLMHVLAVEGARYGILANALAPTAATRMTDGLLGDLADRFDPAHVAAVVTFLVSPRCTFTHRILSAGGGRVARVAVGVNRGWYSGPTVASPEDIEANLESIMDMRDLVIPESGADEVALIEAVVRQQVG